MGCDGNKRPARVVKNGKKKRTEKLKVPRSLILTDALGPICGSTHTLRLPGRCFFLNKLTHAKRIKLRL